LKTPDLLPCPRSIIRHPGAYSLPAKGLLYLEGSLTHDTVLILVAKRLQSAAKAAGVKLERVMGPRANRRAAVRAVQSVAAPDGPDGYTLSIAKHGVTIRYREEGGLRAAAATLRQLLREHGRRLPLLAVRDWADFPRRGFMLDISRGRVPKLQTLLDLVEHLADFKLNEFQLYIEHTFAYRRCKRVWRDWGALSGAEIRQLDRRCRELGIELVPNQNSFGHLRQWLEYPPFKKLGEVDMPYEGADGTYLRYPTTLAPNHPGTLPFLRGLYDELLPHFTSRRFNVGCDETWDLGRGQSKALCETLGKGRVYVDFLKKVQREVSARGRQMMFWGDIILHHPELIRELPSDIIALNWGYEANHPFERETGLFAKSRMAFYVCPGTSTWMTLVGRHDNAFENLRHAARAGRRHGAIGYLNTDWGDGGHPQPLAVSYLPILAGAALSWCGRTFDEKLLVPVLSRDVFCDSTQRAASAALALGLAHRKLDYFQPNLTPLGAVVAAPLPKTREIPCRDGLKYYARIPAKNIRAAMEEVQTQRGILSRARPSTPLGGILVSELDLAARMAIQSCKIMLWQQALAARDASRARQLAQVAIQELRDLDRDFRAYWPLRNKGTTQKCSAFLAWRIDDYCHKRLHFPPSQARGGSASS
jgi:hypothetical protein